MRLVQWLLLGTVCFAVTMATGHKNCKRMATFNAGLLNAVGGQSNRIPLIIDALKRSDDEFVCMQELWWEEDMTDIIEGVKATFPHHYSLIHSAQDYIRGPSDQCVEVKDIPCSLQEVQLLGTNIQTCGMREGCFAVTGVAQNVCLVQKCSHVFTSKDISETCVACPFFLFPVGFAEALQKCATPTAKHNRLNHPGLVVLSKHRMNRAAFKDLHPGKRAPIKRGYIEAELDDGKLAVCTHLTSVYPIYLEFDLTYGSYVEQLAAEIAKLGKIFGGQTHVLLGDMNTGPKVDDEDEAKNLTGEFPQNYQKLIDLGYRSSYMEQVGLCTHCKTNSLTSGNSNNVLDQVLIHPRDAFSIPFTERAYDDSQQLLSDHYGTRADVCDP